MEKIKKKKKFWKVFLISFGSLLGLIIIVLCVALWLVFTPSRITPIINKQIPKFIAAEAVVDKAELTFFSSFPVFGIKAEGVRLTNHVDGAPCDEVVNVKTLRAAIDIKAFLKRDELILSDILLKDGNVCAYIDAQGRANFDVMLPEDPDAPQDEESDFTLSYIDLDDVRLENIKLSFTDDGSGMAAQADNLSARVKGAMRSEAIDALATVAFNSLSFRMAGDSLPMNAVVGSFSGEIKGKLDGDRIVGATLKLKPFKVSLDYGAERYLDNVELSLNADIKAGDIARMFFNIGSARLTAGGLALDLGGSAELGDSITTDLYYKLQSWPLTGIAALVPASFSKYMEGIEIDGGTVSSEGTVKGVMKDSTRMPVIDMKLMLEGVSGRYEELVPVPLESLNANIHVVTNLMDDRASLVEVESLAAKTPKSSVSLSGNLNRLFSDIHFAGKANADIDLAEFATMLPDTVESAMKGRVKLALDKADLSLGQIEKMALEKMKLAGTIDLAGVDVLYDTITLVTNATKVDFSMPSENSRQRSASFAGLRLTGDQIDASMGAMKASLTGTDIILHTSDIRDTTMLPAMRCEFGFGHISASLDETTNVNVYNPSGSVMLAQASRRSASPRYGVTFRSGGLSADYEGDHYSYDKIDVRANVTYNEKEEELFLRFLPRGSIDLLNAKVNMKSINDPIEIPAVKMDFNPFEFHIEHTQVNVGDSDFKLEGRLYNIMPYFRGDSILRGEFDFTSKYTDLGALMALTTSDTAEEEVEVKDEEGANPFLVPKRTDITLHANIDKAVIMEFFADTLSNVKGDIQVIDDKLLLDGLTFTSPLAAMQLSALYRSIRPDHLYAYLDFHLLQIEIDDLLSVVPSLQELLPMLASFRGKGEFHLGAEVYMWGDYSLKMPTLRGAASIDAEQLTLIDGKTLTRILEEMSENGKARKLFKTFIFDPIKGVQIDDLTAEFSVFRETVKVFPFLLSIDKYKAVIEGNQNLDMSFDYTISLVESPLPFRMTIDVSQKPNEDMKFSHFKLKGENMDVYRPESRKAVGSQTLQLRKLIKDARSATVRPWDEEDLKRMKGE